MTIKIGINSNVVSYDFKYFADGVFQLKNEDDEKISIETPLKLDDSFEKEGKEFDVYFLAKKEIKENDIFQVFVKNKRIGWIIPINSLDSSEHDYADNQHYLKYAYIGAKYALKKADESIYLKAIDLYSEIIKFSDVFHEATVLLIISKGNLNDKIKFDLDRASPSLVKYGYVKLGSINPDEIRFIADSPDGDSIKLELISEFLDSYQLISELLNSSLFYEKKPVFKFFFIYQIFELLIDNIYQNEQERLVNKLVNAKGDFSKTKKLFEDTQNFTSEKKRFGLLINKYTATKGEMHDLKNYCNEFLKLINRDEGNEFNEYFYSIRNFIFHQYRDFPKEDGELILDFIIKETVDILPSILSTYKVSDNNLQEEKIKTEVIVSTQ